MARKLIYIPPMDPLTHRRIVEIQFYYIIKAFSLGTQQNENVTNIIESIAKIINVNPTATVIASLETANPHNLPNNKEIAATMAYLKFPVRKIYSRYGMHCMTYYNNLNIFLKNNEPLRPRFDIETDNALEAFINNFKDIVKLLGIIYHE